MRERIARPRGTGKPLQIAVDDVTGTTEPTRYRYEASISATGPQQYFPFFWDGGHGIEPYEQSTQQSPGLGLSRWLQPLQS